MSNNISLKHFVDINIKGSVARSVSGTRDTMVLFTTEGVAGTTHVITSLPEAIEIYSPTTFPNVNAYLTVFFENGGVKCKVIEATTPTKQLITELDNEFIVVGFATSGGSASTTFTTMKSLAKSLNADSTIYGINEKIILARFPADESPTLDEEPVKNFAVKYSDVHGAEMTMGAYLTKINVYKQDTVHDYAFTQEELTGEVLTDTIYEDLAENNYNVDCELVNSIRNLGGNLKDGAELTNTFVKIMLHQTLTFRLMNLLVQKLKNENGIAQIYSVIAQELESYKSAGYLSRDKVWVQEDLDISYNGKTYTIVEQGSALINGYIIKILPLSSLTTEDKAQHKVPPIYVVIADQYGIRQITINGEVL